MPAGRPPKPTALRELGGNAGRRPLNTAEPRPAAKLPTPPQHLNAEARREWRRMGKILLGQGLVTEIDRPALAAYCVAYARWALAERKLNEPEEDGQAEGAGMVAWVRDKEGNRLYPVQSPWLAISNKAQEQMRQMLIQFGMTPSSRSKVTAVPLLVLPMPRA